MADEEFYLNDEKLEKDCLYDQAIESMLRAKQMHNIGKEESEKTILTQAKYVVNQLYNLIVNKNE